MTTKPRLSEREFTAQVLALARLCGWLCAHFRPARTAKGWRTPCAGDAKGWPDCVFVRAGVILFVELKVPPNRVTPEQAVWLRELQEAGLYARVWTPEMWHHIEATLKGD